MNRPNSMISSPPSTSRSMSREAKRRLRRRMPAAPSATWTRLMSVNMNASSTPSATITPLTASSRLNGTGLAGASANRVTAAHCPR